MRKIRKLFSMVIVSILVGSFIFSTTIYGINSSTEFHLRVPISPENMVRVTEAIKTGEHSPLPNFYIINALPKALEALADRDLNSKHVLVRVNMNVPWSEDPNTQRLDFTKAIGDFLLVKGAIPIFFAHNGRNERGRDVRESLEATTGYLNERVFPGKAVFHKGSISKEGLTVSKSDMIPNKVNVIDNVRLADFVYDDKTKQSWEKFAESLIALSDGILIVDAFGDVASRGPDIEIVPLLAEEVYLGPEMTKECATLKDELEEGFDAVVYAGFKPDKIEFFRNVFSVGKKNGFILMGSITSYEFDGEQRALKEELQALRPDIDIMTAEGDYRDSIKGQLPFDIGDKALKRYLAKLDRLEKGDRVLVSGTMGIMEDQYGKLIKNYPEEVVQTIMTGVYKTGTIAIIEKLKELRDRGVKIVKVGGDTNDYTKMYGLVGKGCVEFSGGGTPMQLAGKKVVTGLKAMYERFKDIENGQKRTRKFLELYMKKVRNAMHSTNPSDALWRFFTDMIDKGERELIPYLYEFLSKNMTVEEMDYLSRATFEVFTGVSVEDFAGQSKHTFGLRTMPVLDRAKFQSLILTLTLNPCLDLSVDFGMFPTQPDAYSLEAGGKGINITVGLKKWGIEEGLITCGFLGLHTGAIMVNLLERQNIATGSLTQIAQATRINMTVHNQLQDQIHTTSRGCTVVSNKELTELEETIWQYLKEGDSILIAGALPKGVPEDYCFKLISKGNDMGVKTYVDTKEPWLKHAIKAKPHFLGVNVAELAAYLQTDLKKLQGNLTQIVECIKTLVYSGIDVVVISMGEEGIVMVTKEGAWIAIPPSVKDISNVAAGDTIKVAFAYVESKGGSHLEALQLAAAASAATVTKKGSNISSLAEAKELYDRVLIRRLYSSTEEEMPAQVNMYDSRRSL
ncbi:MAG: phosphoglycerate kinase [Planctomycetota bacterium]